MTLKTKSIKSAVMLRVTIVFLVSYVVVAAGLYHLVVSNRQAQQQADLGAQADRVVKILKTRDASLSNQQVEALLNTWPDTTITLVDDLEEAGAELDSMQLADGRYQTARAVTPGEAYVVLSQAQQSAQDLLVPIGIGGVLLLAVIILALAESLKREMRIFDRINRVFRTVIAQPSLKTLPVNDIAYLETQELVTNLNDMMAIIDEQNLKQLRFISDVSHELRTPVSVMKGYMSMLLRWGKEDAIVLNESLQASLKETTRMEIMIKDMLDMIRIQGSFEDHLTDVTDVEDSLDTVLSNFKVLYNDVVFRVDMAELLPLAQIYQVHFEQLLVILIDNAIKYSPAKKEIDLSLQTKGEYLLLTVRDQGQGISQEDVKHIFDRFFRTSQSRNRQETSAGVGIGLSLLKQITDAYGIAVDVQSAVGQGTAFILTIPTAQWSEDLLEDSYD